MEFTNNELIAAQQAMGKLPVLPIKISLTIADLMIELDKPIKAFTIVRDSLIRQYDIKMEPQPDGGMRLSSDVDGNAQKFGVALNELLATTTELEVTKVKLPSNIKVEPSVLVVLEKFVEI